MLAIEIDGETHDQRLEKDEKRQRELESLGIHVLRFHDSDVKQNLDSVINTIRDRIEENEGNQR